MSQQVRCQNCGAQMRPGPDGRVYACPYCTAQAQVAIDGAQIALGMKLDLANAERFLVELAGVLRTALADRTKIHADGERIISIELDLEPDVFIARREARGVIAQHKKLVRGVALKTKTHPLDKWVWLLSEALAEHANENARAAEVLALIRGV